MIATTPMLAFIQNIGMFEWVAIGAVALLLFGKRLPEVGRSLGRGIVEFKKGLKETTDEISQASTETKPEAPRKIDSSVSDPK